MAKIHHAILIFFNILVSEIKFSFGHHLLDVENCGITQNCFRFPTGCELFETVEDESDTTSSDSKKCTIISWIPNIESSSIDFKITSRLDSDSSIGFAGMSIANDYKMSDGEAYTCQYNSSMNLSEESNGTFMIKRMIEGQKRPEKANEQVIMNSVTSTEATGSANKQFQCSFTRPNLPDSENAYDTSKGNEFYLLLAHGGMDAAGIIQYHGPDNRAHTDNKIDLSILKKPTDSSDILTQTFIEMTPHAHPHDSDHAHDENDGHTHENENADEDDEENDEETENSAQKEDISDDDESNNSSYNLKWSEFSYFISIIIALLMMS